MPQRDADRKPRKRCRVTSAIARPARLSRHFPEWNSRCSRACGGVCGLFGSVEWHRCPVSRSSETLPRRCGLATYTSHVLEALRDCFPTLVVNHYAINDPWLGDRARHQQRPDRPGHRRLPRPWNHLAIGVRQWPKSPISSLDWLRPSQSRSYGNAPPPSRPSRA